MGRLRTRTVSLWLSENEYEYLEKKAKTCGISKSDLIRREILNGAVINIDTGRLKDAVIEINRIGVNINQIAYKLNSTGSMYENDFNILKSLYMELVNDAVKMLTEFIEDLSEKEIG